MKTIRRHENQPPGEHDAPRPGQGTRGRGAGQHRDTSTIAKQVYRSNLLFSGPKTRGNLVHVGEVVPRVFIKLVLLALSNRDLPPDVRQHLEDMIS